MAQKSVTESGKFEKNFLYKILGFFIPYYWAVSGFVLIYSGSNMIKELNGVGKYIVAIGLVFMCFGLLGKLWNALEENYKNDKIN